MSDRDHAWDDACKYARIVCDQYAALWRLYDADTAYDMEDEDDRELFATDVSDALAGDASTYLSGAATLDTDALLDAATETIDSDVLDVTVCASLRDWISDRGEPSSVDITLATGGPAYGIEYDGRYARFWFQDWFTPRLYPPMPDSDALDRLGEYWLDYAASF